MARVIGIDPGIAETGWGIVELGDDGFRCVAHGCIRTRQDQPKEMRLKTIYDSLLKIISQYEPDIMAIEKIFFNANVKTAMSVGQSRGVCMLAAAVSGLKTYEYNSSAVKNIITGRGRASKKEVARCVCEILHMDKIPRPYDVTDALAIALAHLLKQQQRSSDASASGP
ncbi:MAG: crossover junction endodeoxyribonuclease RuvC [Candidatus Methanospirare jalkutatii]|nr:crossover junction endodeoxyribonuclease RuvC [Candidatus Methanospirare jalkutatii]MCW7077818.1 crossover junction endodeoxyribonuclease RuvC [Candidatus Methanoxibalbensis ujae]